MKFFSMAKFLEANRSINGSRDPERWFSLPGKPVAAQRRFGCGPAVLSACMKNWQAGPSEVGTKSGRDAGILFL